MANTEPEPEIIEVIEEVLDNQMFLAAVAVGVVVGAVAIILYMQSKGQMPSLRLAPQMDAKNAPEEIYDESEQGA